MITDKEVMCVEIAALYHDTGHGPFSHFWDNVVVKNYCKNPVSHENQFREMWIEITNTIKIQQMLQANNITEDDQELIDRIIRGKPTKEDKSILFSIVSNPDSGMDVDKWDYLARDSYQLGQMSNNYRIDIDRMIHFARAVKDKNCKWKIAFRDKERLNVIQVFQLRYHLNKTAYRHKKVIAIQLMMYDGIKKCIDAKIIDGDQINNAKWILKNTDSIFLTSYQNQNIEEFSRIFERDIYQPITEAVKYKIIKNDACKELEEFLKTKEKNIENIRISLLKFEFGNFDENPIKKIPFYSKSNNKRIIDYNENDIPPCLDLKFYESRIIIFSTNHIQNNQDNQIVDIKLTIEEWFQANDWIYNNI